MHKYRISLSYDGFSFSGWQLQPNAFSIQGCLQNTFEKLIDETIHVVGSGRTDAGVHAKNQVAHFTTEKKLPKNFLDRANAFLPPAIRLLSLEKTSPDFHACFSAVQKTYHYHISKALVLSPFEARYRTHLSYRMDLLKLQKALKYFIGTQDFSSFANKRGVPFSPVKTIHSIDYISEGEDMFRLQFTGDGFLYKMVRNIVGTLIYIARGKIPLDAIPHLFAAKDRRKAPPPAPPQGLYLISVVYKNNLNY